MRITINFHRCNRNIKIEVVATAFQVGNLIKFNSVGAAKLFSWCNRLIFGRFLSEKSDNSVLPNVCFLNNVISNMKHSYGTLISHVTN